jgi:hypothetical protein
MGVTELSPLAVSSIAFAIVFGAGLVGTILPGHRFPEGTKDVVRLGAGLIGTIAGLVLGLLVGSANNSYEAQSNAVQRMTTDIILLDNLLDQYGPQAHKARVLLRASIGPFVGRVWGTSKEPVEPFKPTAAGEAFFLELDGLVPQDDAQRSIKARALTIFIDAAQSRVSLQERALTSIPMPFLFVLIAWLAIIFMSFGLFAEGHYSVLFALFVFTLSASVSIFLILELTHPFVGFMRIPNDALLYALPPLAG